MDFLFKDFGLFLLSFVALLLLIVKSANMNFKIRRILIFSCSLVCVVGLLVSIYTHISKKRIGATCEDGSKSSSVGQGTCSYHGGVDQWAYEYWYEKGELTEQESVTQNTEDNTLLNGKQIQYYDNGKIYLVVQRKDGQLHGQQLSYYYNGNLEYKKNYSNGIILSEQTYWEETGELSTSSQYLNGEKTGQYINVNSAGEKYIGNYMDGLPHGEFNFFDLDTNIVATVTYDKGKKIKTVYEDNCTKQKKEEIKITLQWIGFASQNGNTNNYIEY